jgi:NETI protein
MSKGKSKMQFEVLENETIGECLERIKKHGYFPVRRIEKPIFKEVINGNETSYEPVGRQIIFEAKINDNNEQ